jgi:hypothetical protein
VLPSSYDVCNQCGFSLDRVLSLKEVLAYVPSVGSALSWIGWLLLGWLVEAITLGLIAPGTTISVVGLALAPLLGFGLLRPLYHRALKHKGGGQH